MATVRLAEAAVPGGLEGDLDVPTGAVGLVAFAHGSGSSRHSPRNRAVARALVERGLATLLVDLLTAGEERRDERDAALRFDIGLLGARVAAVLDDVRTRPAVGELPVGLFGASTGAAAALVAAAERADVASVVSRGGRPDLAGEALARVRAPVLLLVGERDEQVLALNQRAAAALGGPHELVVVPGATHLFPEPGALEDVAARSADWFVRTLPPPGG